MNYPPRHCSKRFWFELADVALTWQSSQQKDSLGPLVKSLPPPLSLPSPFLSPERPLSLFGPSLSRRTSCGRARAHWCGRAVGGVAWGCAVDGDAGEDAAAAGSAISSSASTVTRPMQGAAAQRRRTRWRRAVPSRAPCQRRHVHPRQLRLRLHHGVHVNGSSSSNSIPSNGSTPS